MQGYQNEAFDLLSSFLGSEFEDSHWNSTKMASNPTTSTHRISSVRRWISLVPRYVALLAPIYLLNGGDLCLSLRSPEIATVDFGSITDDGGSVRLCRRRLDGGRSCSAALGRLGR
ncbi:hypothetical protein V6N11_010938 [Hibiscus sabdariffa]|uniref:Uncharacterized protein n=1 Tax=Hibiscus sabdariffa TaxID=183260 RepID=A0ABR2S6Q0_9ROSI